jgi:hypothetical protein
MPPEEVIAQVKKRAKANFKTGLNCAECVFEAVLAHVDTGLPHESMCVIEAAGLAAEMAAPKDLARWGARPFGDNVEGRE